MLLQHLQAAFAQPNLDIEITLDGNLKDFTENMQLKFLGVVDELLDLKGNIYIKRKRSGSVKVTIELPYDKVEKLKLAIKSGYLEKFRIVSAEIIVNQIYQLRKEAIKESLADFKSLEHRLEYVANVRGVECINDSKATNVNSAWYALESMTKPVIWIAGGVEYGK